MEISSQLDKTLTSDEPPPPKCPCSRGILGPFLTQGSFIGPPDCSAAVLERVSWSDQQQQPTGTLSVERRDRREGISVVVASPLI